MYQKTPLLTVMMAALLAASASSAQQGLALSERCDKLLQGWSALGVRAPADLYNLCGQLAEDKDRQFSPKEVVNVQKWLDVLSVNLMAARDCTDMTKAMLGFPHSKCLRLDAKEWVDFGVRQGPAMVRIMATDMAMQSAEDLDAVRPGLAAIGIKAPAAGAGRCMRDLVNRCGTVYGAWGRLGAPVKLRAEVFATCRAKVWTSLEDDPSCDNAVRVSRVVKALEEDFDKAEQCLSVTEALFGQRPSGCFTVSRAQWADFYRWYRAPGAPRSKDLAQVKQRLAAVGVK